MQIPAFADLNIKAFSAGAITELESGTTNGVLQVVNGKPTLTQRPAIDVVEDAGTSVADTKGRGLFYWDEQSTLYLINDGTLYKGDHATSISTSPTAGTKRCYFFPIGGRLAMLDPENDQGFTIQTNDTVTEITDTDFPPKQTPAVGLAHGGAVLNNVLYVLGEDGIVYGSDNADATAWSALNFIGATRVLDGGAYLAKHHDNLAVMGFATIEFFYDAGNATGSALSRRQDVAYNIGCAFGDAVWENGDQIFFVGVDAAGAMGVYLLEQFTPRKISTATIDSYLTQSVVKETYTIIGSGLSGAGHDFYILTIVSTPDSVQAEQTLVYDATSQVWSIWETSINDITKLPIVDWTKRYGAGTQYGQGILINGDIIAVNDNLIPVDTLLGLLYVVADYVEAGYVSETAGTGTNVTMQSRTGMFEGDGSGFKGNEYLRYVGNTTPSTQTLSITWANEDNESFSSARTLDTSKRQKIGRLGRFMRRNHNLSYAGDEQIHIESLEIKPRLTDQ